MRENGTFKLYYDIKIARLLVLGLLAMELAMLAIYVLLHIALDHLRWGPLSLFFDLDLDASIPAWFSSMQLFFAAMLGFAVATCVTQYRWFILLCSTGLLFLSVDEGASIHERITEFAIAHDIAFLQAVMIGNHGAWIVPYLVAGAILATVCIKPILHFLKHFPKPFFFAVAGLGVMVMGAVGLEVVSYLFLRDGADVGYKLEVAGEEFLEMAGVTLVVYGLLVFGLQASQVSTPARTSSAPQASTSLNPGSSSKTRPSVTANTSKPSVKGATADSGASEGLYGRG